MLPSDRKEVFSHGKLTLWEIFDREFLVSLDWSDRTLKLAGGEGALKETIRVSDRIGVIAKGDQTLAGVGFWVRRMQPHFWFAPTRLGSSHALELVRFLGRLKRAYPQFAYTRQNERLLEVIERWACSRAQD